MDYKILSEQLRKPEGEFGLQICAQMNLHNAILNRWSFNLLSPEPNDKILEIGMANGFFIRELMETADGLHYTGADHSPLMIQKATELNADGIEDKRVKLVLAAADNLPFNDNSFDKILCVNTIYFWDAPQVELAELYRVLLPGGKMVMSFCSQDTMRKYPYETYGLKTYAMDDAALLLASNGFIIVDMSEDREPDTVAGIGHNDVKDILLRVMKPL